MGTGYPVFSPVICNKAAKTTAAWLLIASIKLILCSLVKI